MPQNNRFVPTDAPSGAAVNSWGRDSVELYSEQQRQRQQAAGQQQTQGKGDMVVGFLDNLMSSEKSFIPQQQAPFSGQMPVSIAVTPDDGLMGRVVFDEDGRSQDFGIVAGNGRAFRESTEGREMPDGISPLDIDFVGGVVSGGGPVTFGGGRPAQIAVPAVGGYNVSSGAVADPFISPLATRYASLDIDIPVDGREYVFTSPRGEVALQARCYAEGDFARLQYLFVSLFILAAAFGVERVVRRRVVAGK
jgi:hypothetical protein